MGSPEPIFVQVHCRLEVLVTDPDRLRDRAVAEVQQSPDAARDGWGSVEAAAAAVSSDVAQAVEALVKPTALLADLPSVTLRGGHIWAEVGQRPEAEQAA